MAAASPPLPLLSHSQHLNGSALPHAPPQQQRSMQLKQAPAKPGAASASSPIAPTSAPPSSTAASSSSQSQPLLPAVSLQSLLSSALSAADRVDECSRYFSTVCRSRELQGHRRPVNCLRWNAAGSRLASAGVDSVIHVWTLQPLLSSSGGGFVPSNALSATELRGHSDKVEQLAWCEAEQAQHLLASASVDQTMRIFDTNTGRCVFTLSCGGVNISIAWSKDGRRIAVGNKRNSISLIDVPSLPSCAGCRVLAVLNYSYEINDIAFAGSGGRRMLALSTSKGSVDIVDTDAAAASSSSSSSPVQLSNPTPLCSLDNHSTAVYCLALSSDGRLLGSGGADAVVCVRETAQLTPLCLLQRLDSPIRCLSFSHPSLSLIAVGGEDGQLELSALDAATGSRVWQTQLSAELNSLAFHPSLPLLAIATDSKDKCSVSLFGVA